MKKIGLIVFLITLVISVFSISAINAKTKAFSLTKAEIKEKSSTTTVNSFSFKNETITSDVTFHKEGDYVTYKLIVKNVSKRDLKISSVTDNNKDKNVTYEYSKYKGTKIKAGDMLTLNVKAKYNKKETDVDKRDKKTSVKIYINYIDKNGKSGVTGLLINPDTGDKIMIIVAAFLTALVTILGILIGKKRSLNKKRLAISVMVLSLVLPIGVRAAEAFNITFTSNYSLRDKVVVTINVDGTKIKKVLDYNTKLKAEDLYIDGKKIVNLKTSDGKTFDISKPIKEDIDLKADCIDSIANLDTGSNINVKMKNLANDYDGYAPDYDEFTITYIKKGEKLPDNYEISESKTISLSDSTLPVYIWWDDDSKTIYWYTEADKIYMNSDSAHMFEEMESLKGVSFLEYLDSSNITTIEKMFAYTYDLEDYDSVKYLDTTNVTNMDNVFRGAYISDITPLAAWDTSNVTTMEGMFSSGRFTTTTALSSWKTSKVTNMVNMFEYCSELTSISGLTNWDTTSLVEMKEMFRDCSNLESLEPLRGFNVDNVTDMNYLFSNCSKISSLEPLSNWRPSKVKSMDATFYGLAITNLHGLENWYPGELLTMKITFANCTKLTDVSAMASWNHRQLNNISGLFSHCTSLENVNSLINWYTYYVTDMSSLFSGCSNLTDPTVLSHWATYSVTDTSYMFYNAEKASGRIRFQNNVTNYSRMFTGAATNTDGYIQVDYHPSYVDTNVIRYMVGTKSANSKVYVGQPVY